ncbi:MAG: sigma 54-interacting transcriptional regulator [Myxococcales bacterium]|nr:sigma 54-interacting transcriptional regulator [Myxococcales bacterium]
MRDEAPPPKTQYVTREIVLDHPRLVVLSGARKGEELELRNIFQGVTVGSSPECELVFEELLPIHAKLDVLPNDGGLRIRDRSNGQTALNGFPVKEAVLEPGCTFKLGSLEIGLENAADTLRVLPSASTHFGDAKGESLAMREVFGVLEAVASTDVTVLLLGETGTGKDVLAHAVHAASSRRSGPLVTIDCGAIAPSLIESELFGYERGAFTGAETEHAGAFEAASGGTLFLDEVGELPLDVQPKLLRSIDEKQVQRVGGSIRKPANVRLIAATKRNLDEEVHRGRFRRDLYFRLAIVPLTLPPLRERREDIPLLVDTFCTAFAKRTSFGPQIQETELQALCTHDWPGNVRELKNTVERALWLAQTGDGDVRFMLPTPASLRVEEAPDGAPQFDPGLSFSEHKQHWEHDFERAFLPWLLEQSRGSISGAARLARMDRKHLRALLKKHGLAGEN